MTQQFPHVGYHFGVFFMFPGITFNANFKSVGGLDFTIGSASKTEGGVNAFSHRLTDRGSYGSLQLSRGFTNDLGLYAWCEGTHVTLETQPCNILISMLDKNSMPVKNWLVMHAIPSSWSAGNLDVSNSQVMMESVSFSYKSFMMI